MSWEPQSSGRRSEQRPTANGTAADTEGPNTLAHTAERTLAERPVSSGAPLATLRDRLVRLAEALPAAGAVTLTKSDLLSLIGAVDEPNDAVARRGDDSRATDLTAVEVAGMFGRGVSTVRTWLAEGRFPNAYRFRGREWRVPLHDVEAMQRSEAAAFRASRVQTTSVTMPADLGAWRQFVD